MHKTSFNQRRVRYEDIHGIRQEYFDAFVEEANVQDMSRILDCGCGYGAISREILKRLDLTDKDGNYHVEIDLIDESDVQLKRAQEELAAWKENDSRRLCFKQGVFPEEGLLESHYDIVCAKMVLHEVPSDLARLQGKECAPTVDQATFLSGIVRSLRPGGKLLLWDLSLKESVREFFSEVIKMKDVLAGYASMVQRRNFLDTRSLTSLLQSSGLSLIREFHHVKYRVTTSKRLIPEFNGDKDKLERWHEHIRHLAASLDQKTLATIKYADEGSSIAFTVDVGLFRGDKPDSNTLIFEPFSSITKRVVSPGMGAENLRSVTLQSLASGRFAASLSPLNGVFRAGILTRAYGPQRSLCREGLDFVYNPQSPDRVREQVRAYLAYLMCLYAEAKFSKRTGTESTRSMSESLATVFSDTSSSSYLCATLLGETSIRVDLGSYSECAGSAVYSFPTSMNSLFEKALRIAQTNEDLICQESGMGNFFRLSTYVKLRDEHRADLDSLAEHLADELVAHARAMDFGLDSVVDIEHIVPSRLLDRFIASRSPFTHLRSYLIASGCAQCSYILPPSLLWGGGGGRVEDGAVIITSDLPMDAKRQRAAMDYTVGFWCGIGAIEAEEAARRDQMLHEQVARADAVSGFVHQANHIYGDEAKSGFSLMCFADLNSDASERSDISLQEIWIDLRDSAKYSNRQIEFEARSAQLRYAILMPGIVRTVIGSRSSSSVFGQRWITCPDSLMQNVVGAMVVPLMTIKSQRNRNFTCFGKQLAVKRIGQFPDNVLIPGGSLVEAILFETVWNAFRHGFWDGQDVAEVIINGRMHGGMNGPDIYELSVCNPSLANSLVESCTGLKYLRQFANSLGSMRDGEQIRLTISNSHVDRYYEYRVTLTLPWRSHKEV